MSIEGAPLPPVVVLRPSKYAKQGDWIIVSTNLGPAGKIMRRGAGFPEILETAYGFSPEQMILPANLPRGNFDLLLTVPDNSREQLRAEIKKQFGVTAHPETRDMNVLVLKAFDPHASGLKVSAGGGPNIWTGNGSLKLQGYTMADFTHVIGQFYSQPIIDETGLTDAYDVEAKWNANLKGKALQNEIESIMRHSVRSGIDSG